MDAASAVTAIAIALMFAWSGVAKLRTISSSAATLSALRLPRIAPRTAIAALATAEVSIAVGVVMPRPVSNAAAIAAAALAVAFLIVVVRAWRLGSTESCGCFGEGDSSRIGPRLIVRNALVLILTIAACVALASGGEGAPAIVTSPTPTVPVVLAATITTGLAACVMWSHSAPAPAAPASAASPTADASADGPAPAVLIDRVTGYVSRPDWLAREQAQLLVFVRPGCGSCTTALNYMDELGARLTSSVRVSVIAGASVGASVLDAAELESRVTHVDVADAVARRYGIGPVRPAAVLIARDGVDIRPHAEGADRIIELADAISTA